MFQMFAPCLPLLTDFACKTYAKRPFRHLLPRQRSNFIVTSVKFSDFFDSIEKLLWPREIEAPDSRRYDSFLGTIFIA